MALIELKLYIFFDQYYQVFYRSTKYTTNGLRNYLKTTQIIVCSKNGSHNTLRNVNKATASYLPRHNYFTKRILGII